MGAPHAAGCVGWGRGMLPSLQQRGIWSFSKGETRQIIMVQRLGWQRELAGGAFFLMLLERAVGATEYNMQLL